MCSIGEEDFGDEGGAHSMVKDEKVNGVVEDEICKKCKVDKCVIKLDLKDSMCKSCFLLFVRHKFRATLGATKLVPRGAKILVSFSGSANDICLLSMTKLGVDDFSFKKLCVELEVVFVDTSSIDTSDIDEKLKRIEEVKDVMSQFTDIECHYASIEDPEKVLKISEVTKENLKSESNFLKTFNSLQSLTSKQDFIENSKSQSLRKIAKTLDCSFIFISDISSMIAKRLMENMSLGRGSSVAHDVSFCDDRTEEIKILRPLKDLSSIEVESYSKFYNLRFIPTKFFGEDAGKFASIQNLTSSFIDGLQENFSGTVSTVFRSCGKIAPKVEENRCQMCHSAMDVESSKTLFAIEFSRVVSEMADQQLENVEKCEEKAQKAVEGSSIKKNLCHGCRNIFIGLSDEELNEIF